jgi:hypothetical protein
MKSGLKNIKDQLTATTRKVSVKKRIVKEEKKEKINFIITCYNREEYWDHLEKILKSYKLIDANYVLAYNGNDPNFNGYYVGQNRGHSLGEYDCIIGAYNKIIPNSNKWIKISVDSWLLDEHKILKIFTEMEKNKCGFAGHYWNRVEGDISTDIFFVDTNYGNIFEIMSKNEFPFFEHNKYLEEGVFYLLKKNNIKIHLINERNPIHWENRYSCVKLKWTMRHNLDENLNYLKKIK